MSHPDFKNRGTALGKFIEECGEALAAAGKTVRFGRDSVNPLLPESEQETNEDWLRREVTDLEEAIARLKKQWNWTDEFPAEPCASEVAPGVGGSEEADTV